MEGALVSAATGILLKPVLEKLTSVVNKKYMRNKKLHGEIISLSRELEAMHRFMDEMSKKKEDLNQLDKAWTKEMRELSYDIEDNFDEFMLLVDDDKSDNLHGLVSKVKSAFTKIKTHGKIAKEIEKIKIQAKEVGERHERFKSDQIISNSRDATVDHRSLVIFNNDFELVGIDGPRDDLIRL